MGRRAAVIVALVVVARFYSAHLSSAEAVASAPCTLIE